MSKDHRFFYITWGVLWFVLALLAGSLLRSAVEAWFVTFPVAWTAALLAVRCRTHLSAFADHTLMKQVYLITFFGFQAWNNWERGVRYQDSVFKTMGVFFAVPVAGMVVMLAVEVVKAFRQHKKAP